MYPILNGLRVVECASFIAAPSCALYLQQLGAEVIRIDPIGGGMDFARWPVAPGGQSLYWEGLNKGKRSVAIDLSRPEGRELATALITAPGPDAGLLVTNYPQKGFMSHEALSARRSDLVTVRVLGWGDGAPAVDYTVNAALGVPCMTGSQENGDTPVNHVLPAWDLLTGAYAAFAMLAAERHRCRTGQGQEVTVALSDVALASLGNMGQIAEVLTQGDRPRYGNALFGAFGRDFTTADGQRVMVVAITGRQWTGLVTALGLQEPIAALESSLAVSFVADEGQRFVHRDALFPLFERAIGALSLDALRSRFETQGVLWSTYQTLGTALEHDPRLSLDASLFSMLEHPSGLRYPAPGAAATFHGAERHGAVRAPRLGEHTDQVLAEVLSLSSARIGQLHDAGIVATA
ncbi:L-carnitine dehydratase/bile acid-inducible protein F [Acidovorax delafieldii 2AN]|uniref:L-carnitine dehydratase/bile acid-inducible protein F n=1 Tax=Acidovorax delafieldii 2AN TaxID=573060 RepID=C5T158_ACIDE|nr:CoA transferase [Acidovorax delafieldii]EER61802.1 L-carnitine dehydratase/bile acid-inducible protein F [Acidovorax delafieldii 2AN]